MDQWPELPLADWADTCATLQLWTQVVGKIRLAHAPLINHWWQVALYVTPRGLTTSAIPYGARCFQRRNAGTSGRLAAPPLDRGPPERFPRLTQESLRMSVIFVGHTHPPLVFETTPSLLTYILSFDHHCSCSTCLPGSYSSESA